jgi:hypothetical protein
MRSPASGRQPTATCSDSHERSRPAARRAAAQVGSCATVLLSNVAGRIPPRVIGGGRASGRSTDWLPIAEIASIGPRRRTTPVGSQPATLTTSTALSNVTPCRTHAVTNPRPSPRPREHECASRPVRRDAPARRHLRGPTIGGKYRVSSKAGRAAPRPEIFESGSVPRLSVVPA